MKPDICLGTAQFGMSYGITNCAGKVSEDEVKAILKLAEENGINRLDTAQSYGTAEQVLGRTIPSKDSFKIISKLNIQSNSFSEGYDINNMEESFKKTIANLGCNSLEAFLLHQPLDLKNDKNGKLMDWLESLLNRELVKKLGLSIYDSKDLLGINIEKFQIIQLPLSIYDQRLLRDGTISMLKKKGISIHCRSLFLQGLVMKKSNDWPTFISNSFKQHHDKFTEYLNSHGISAHQAALLFIKNQIDIETAVIGLESTAQLKELLNSWNKEYDTKINLDERWSWQDKNDIDPRKWKI